MFLKCIIKIRDTTLYHESCVYNVSHGMSPSVVECVIHYLVYLPGCLLLQGMDLYFQRHDGQAVTCEDFYAAMCDANNAQLPNFLQW